jgi:hypothetical protein
MPCKTRNWWREGGRIDGGREGEREGEREGGREREGGNEWRRHNRNKL